MKTTILGTQYWGCDHISGAMGLEDFFKGSPQVTKPQGHRTTRDGSFVVWHGTCGMWQGYFGFTKKLTAFVTAMIFAFSMILPSAVAEVITVDGGTIDVTQTDNVTNWNVTGNPVWEVPEFNVNEGSIYNITGINNSASLALLVGGGSASNIFGTLNITNLDFILQNVYGINIGSTGLVNVTNANFIASTLPLNLTATNFLTHDYKFEGEMGMITNAGRIVGTNAELVALVANAIENTGTIDVPAGHVVLASGNVVTIGISGDGMVSIGVDEATANELGLKDQIKNTGTITADGGKVTLTAKAIDGLFEKAINIASESQATAVVRADDGVIEFIAEGDITNAGTLQAKNGSIEIDTTGDIENQGTIETLTLREHGQTFRSTGTLKGGDVYMDNEDGAADISGDLGSNVTDTGDINVTGDITLLGDIMIMADSDGDGAGSFLMEQDYTLTGDGYSLSLKASGFSTIGKVTGVENLALYSQSGSATYQVRNAVTLSGDLTVNDNVTLTGGYSVTVGGGDVTGDGVINMTGGTFTVIGPGEDEVGQFGGETDWTFWELNFGDGVTSGITQKKGTNKITALTNLNISLGHELKGGTTNWDLEWGGGYFTDALQVEAGSGFTVALRSDGTVWSWGETLYGRLGNGEDSVAISELMPVQVLGINGSGFLTGVKSIAVGCAHVLALLVTGGVVGWGYNNYGQVGDGTTTNHSSPVAITALDGIDIISLAAGPNEIGGTTTKVDMGGQHSLALTSDGTVYSWGRNDYGQLGRAGNTLVPMAISGLSNVTAISAGSYHSLALLSNGTVYGWGYNAYTQMANAGSYCWTVPRLVVDMLDSGLAVISIAAGSFHSLFLMSDKTVWALGRDNRGQLGNDSTLADSSSLVQVSGLADVASISAGGSHSLALLEDGTVYSWGYNVYGQLGDGTKTNRSVPVVISGFSSDVLQISAGGNISMARLSDGSLMGWGANNIGDNTTDRIYSPVHVLMDFPELIHLDDISQISAGYQFTLALKSDGSEVYSWGTNSYGQLGNGTVRSSNTPVRVRNADNDGYLTDVASISAGQMFALALLKNGTVMSWGKNDCGQLGIGDNSVLVQLLPILVSGLSGVVEISAGGYHALARLDNVLIDDITDDTVVAWGNNTYGQLGLGYTSAAQYAPLAVLGLVGVAEIAAGYKHSLARMSNGTVTTLDDTLMAWGYNQEGQLGINNKINQSTPTLVLGLGGVGILTGIEAIAAGTKHSMALMSNGSVYAWGYNGDLQLGNGATLVEAIGGGADSLVPVEVLGLDDGTVIDIAAAQSISAVLMSDGTVRQWGCLYTSPTTMQNFGSAIELAGVSSAVQLSGVWNHLGVLQDDGTITMWGSNTSGCLGNNTMTTSASPVYVESLAYAPFTVEIDPADPLNNGTFTSEDSTVLYLGEYGFGRVASTKIADVPYSNLVLKYQLDNYILPSVDRAENPTTSTLENLGKLVNGDLTVMGKKQSIHKVDFEVAQQQLEANIKRKEASDKLSTVIDSLRSSNLPPDVFLQLFDPASAKNTTTDVTLEVGAIYVRDRGNGMQFLDSGGESAKVDFKEPEDKLTIHRKDYMWSPEKFVNALPAPRSGKSWFVPPAGAAKDPSTLPPNTQDFDPNPNTGGVLPPTVVGSNPLVQPPVSPFKDEPVIPANVQRGELVNPSEYVFIRTPQKDWQPVTGGMTILPGDEIRTAPGAEVEIALDGGKTGMVKLSGGSLFRIQTADVDPRTGDKTTLLDLAVGKLVAQVEKLKGDSKFEVRTPQALTGVRGTIFTVEVKPKDAA